MFDDELFEHMKQQFELYARREKMFLTSAYLQLRFGSSSAFCCYRDITSFQDSVTTGAPLMTLARALLRKLHVCLKSISGREEILLSCRQQEAVCINSRKTTAIE